MRISRILTRLLIGYSISHLVLVAILGFVVSATIGQSLTAQMRERMTAEGLPYGDRTMTYNSRLAQELGAWADTHPGGDAIHDALFRAYFVEGANIGDVETLVGIAAAVGLSAQAAREVLETRSFGPVVDADWQKSHAYGVTGVPTFVAGRHGVVGAQPYEALEQLVAVAKG